MDELIRLIAGHEEWLMHRVLHYARERGYMKYASQLAEAWRVSIAGLSESLMRALRLGPEALEILSETEFAQDASCSFGVLEAERHMDRGIPLPLFLGLLKYYRDSYLDLVREKVSDPDKRERYLLAVGRFFDRTELGVSVTWCQSETEPRMCRLQESHREITCEKNRYLTLFESLNVPVLLLDAAQRIVNLNRAAARMLGPSDLPGATYYGGKHARTYFPWLAEELRVFADHPDRECSFACDLRTNRGTQHFQVRMQRMLDVDQQVFGTVVVMSDVTDRKRLENMLRALQFEDPLTRLCSWRAFMSFAGQQVALAARQQLKALLLMVCVENAGEILEKLGRPEHDRLLAELAALMRKTLRASDLLGRYRDNVFVAFVMGGDVACEPAVVGRLRRAVEQSGGTGASALALSISSAGYDPSDPCTLDELILRADESRSRTRLPSLAR